MNAEMPGFITYREAALIFSLMSDEEAAQAIKATVNYFLYDEFTPLAGAAQKAFDVMRASIDEGREKYLKQVEAGKRGAAKRYGSATL